jgi:DNA-binding response OmpR family regulator
MWECAVRPVRSSSTIARSWAKGYVTLRLGFSSEELLNNKMIRHAASAKRILVVEDEPAITAVCQRVLASEGFEVDVATNGKIAQDMIENKQYDLCLIDIRTPMMNGEELYQWLRERHSPLTKRVVFTSGDTLSGDTQSLAEQAGRPFLPKPFSPDELRAVVTQVLSEIGR